LSSPPGNEMDEKKRFNHYMPSKNNFKQKRKFFLRLVVECQRNDDEIDTIVV
jgi:hypothetical protein